MPEEKRAHSVFLPEAEGDEVLSEEEIGVISIVRTAPHQENAGQTYTPAELVSPGTILRLFGGGSYKVMARSRNGHVLKGGTRYFHFRGPSYPMDGSGPPAPAPPPVAAAAAAPGDAGRYMQAPPAAPIDLSPFARMMENQSTLFVELFKILAARGGGGAAAEGSGDVDTLIAGFNLGQSAIKQVMDARENALAEVKEHAAGAGGDDVTSTLQAVTQAVTAFGAMKGSGGPVKSVNGKKAPPPKAET